MLSFLLNIFDQNKVKTVILWNIITIKLVHTLIVIDGKAEFSASLISININILIFVWKQKQNQDTLMNKKFIKSNIFFRNRILIVTL